MLNNFYSYKGLMVIFPTVTTEISLEAFCIACTRKSVAFVLGAHSKFKPLMVHFTANYMVITSRLVTALSIKITIKKRQETAQKELFTKELQTIKIYILPFFIAFQSI